MKGETIEQQLARHEGVKSKPYKDTVGKLTIGVGRNLDDVGLSMDEIYYLLRNDLNRVRTDIANNCPWFENLSPERQKVIENMVFNLGIVKFLQFKNTIRLISEGKYDDVAKAMLDSRWAQQVGKRATELSEMMRLGG